LDEKTHFYCPDCIVGNVHWCIMCGEAFEPADEKELICKDCQRGE
jgi:hypothetical protein